MKGFCILSTYQWKKFKQILLHKGGFECLHHLMVSSSLILLTKNLTYSIPYLLITHHASHQPILPLIHSPLLHLPTSLSTTTFNYNLIIHSSSLSSNPPSLFMHLPACPPSPTYPPLNHLSSLSYTHLSSHTSTQPPVIYPPSLWTTHLPSQPPIIPLFHPPTLRLNHAASSH